MPDVKAVEERPEFNDLLIVLRDGGAWSVDHTDFHDHNLGGMRNIDRVCQMLFDRGALRLVRHRRVKTKSVQPERIFT